MSEVILNEPNIDSNLLIPDDGLMLNASNIDRYVYVLLSKYVPSTTGDKTFAEITKDYGGAGTTCGYLCHWLMWRIGFRDSKIVNRNEQKDGLKYSIGANISKIWNSGKSPFEPYTSKQKPYQLGDIIFISNGTPDTEHVFVFRQESEVYGDFYFQSYDAGQTDSKTGKQCSLIKTRKRKGNILTNIQNGITKKIVGGIRIRNLSLTAPAKPF